MKLFPKTPKGIVLSLLRIGVVIYLVVVGALFFAQERLIFFPHELPANFQYGFHHSYIERWTNFEGGRLNSVIFKAEDPEGVILYFHGNAGAMDSWGEIGEALAQRTNWDVWMVDFPGYGKSDGAIHSEAQLHAMSEVIWQDLDDQYSDTTKRIIYGRSVGTGLAAELATKHPANGLILESPYFNLVDMTHFRFPWVPTALLRYTLHSDQWVPKVTSPVLLIQGTSDEVIPFTQGEKLAALAKGATFVPISGGHHNDLAEFDEFWKTLGQWLKARTE